METTTVAHSADDPLLDVRGLRVDLSGDQGCVHAVDGVDLTVSAGEVVALVGESGSGKTMTARSILRLLPAGGRVVGGSVRLGAVDLLQLPEKKLNDIRGKRVSMVFQEPRATLDPTCTVGAHVTEPLRIHQHLRRGRARERAIELLAEMGIPEPRRRMRTYAHQLSGGMAQRVMMATAMGSEPELLIADEPTTALDVTVQAQILRLLLRQRDETGLAVLLITHDLGMVASVADRVIVMYAGRVVEDAPTKTLFANPRHPYTQALLRCSLLDPDQQRLFVLPSGANGVERGCRFRSRCAVAEPAGCAAQCETAEPDLVLHAGGHHVRCWGDPVDEDAS